MIFLIVLFFDLVFADTLRQVLIFNRHGQRAPTSYLIFPTDNPHLLDNFTFELGELTPWGMREAYNLGLNLKQQYGDFLGPRYKPKETRFMAGDDNRTITSALTMLAALFPSTNADVWSSDFDWQPIPVHTDQLIDAVSFGVFSICGALKERVLVSQSFQNILDSLSDAKDILGNLTGVNITDAWELDRVLDSILTRAKMSDVLPPPEWAQNPEFLSVLRKWMNQIHVYLIDLLQDRSGGWHFDLILGQFEQFLRGFHRHKFVLFSGHDTNIMAISRYFNLDTLAKLELQNYASYLAVELHQDPQNNFYIEFWLHPDLNGTRYFVEITDCLHPCLYSKFRTLRPRTSSDQWNIACHGMPQGFDNHCTFFAAVA
uniref:Acid phosphatase n=1 Tax=Panagrolaimus sp. JU765 TaxID=591449 RepID=A0AC34Q889_9BILA